MGNLARLGGWNAISAIGVDLQGLARRAREGVVAAWGKWLLSVRVIDGPNNTPASQRANKTLAREELISQRV